ncbi:hypothetical protein GDO86_007589 [Hymenochirus boettgeri]|uniref:Hexosyltransferase n=1 Tax=Hymenochirus boettgeri TaxID=247094 RepID=A0A8T2J2D7_9PIPI|nr:hypothetical protein GDO86_007589 [Hymenochirus boettgeri]
MSPWRRRLCIPLLPNWRTRHLMFNSFVILALLFLMVIVLNNRWIPNHIMYKEIMEMDSAYSFQLKESETVKVLQKLVVSGRVNQTENQKLLAIRASKRNTSNRAAHHVGYYSYLINEPNKCQRTSPFLILLIAVEPQQLNAREAIRQTWGKEDLFLEIQVIRLFLLGREAKLTTNNKQAIVNESIQHHDIIQQDFLDTYNNLTIKTLMGMHWIATFCPNVSYVMKTDSDMFVNTEYLIKKLLKPVAPKTKYFTGYLMKGYAPNRNKDSKWYMSQELYPGDMYPPFCSGTGYVFSGDLAEKIFKMSLSTQRLHLEDVFIGICLANLGVNPVSPPKVSDFNIWRVSYSDCVYNQLVTSHEFQPSELVKYWNQLQKNKNLCVIHPK